MLWFGSTDTMTNSRILEKKVIYLATLCSFWKNLSGHFERFVCNHSYCYAFRRIVQTDSLRFSQNPAFL
jgi:hypothetical protein